MSKSQGHGNRRRTSTLWLAKGKRNIATIETRSEWQQTLAQGPYTAYHIREQGTHGR